MKFLYFLNVTNHEEKLPYFLHGASYNYNQEFVNAEKGFNWYQLNICKSGSGTLIVNGLELQIKPGDSFIIYPDVPYKYIPFGNSLYVHWIAFDGFQVSSMFKSMGITGSGLYHFNNINQIFSSIESLESVQNCSVTEQPYCGSELVYKFLLTLQKNIKFSSGDDLSIDKLKPSLDYMQQHLGQQIGIDDIAGSMNITPQHFCLIFKKIMNQRPFEYLNKLRINYSKNLLINNKNYSVKEISKLSGYPNHSYFCQIFKKLERITPVEFRNLYSNT